MAWKPKRPGQTMNQYHEQFANDIIELIEKGVAPWQKEWKPGETHMPANFSTRVRYQGGNAIHLMVKGAQRSYNDHRWGTYNQIREAGGQVRKGEKGVSILVFKPNVLRNNEQDWALPVRERADADQPEQRARPMWKRYTVFNAEQADGLKLPRRETAIPEWQGQENVERVLREIGVPLRHISGGRAFYSMAKDEIVLPEKGQFQKSEHYYQTALHELGHASGHPDRLNRESLKLAVKHGFGSEQYAREELRAEISAMMSGDRLGTGHNPQHGAAYVENWVQALTKNPKEIQFAAADATQISNYVCGGPERVRAPEQEPERAPGAPRTDGPGTTQRAIPDPLAARDTPLHHAAGIQGSERQVRELLANGSDPNVRDEHGVTPLLHAVSSDSPESVQHLLQTGADPNLRALDGAAPLHFAVNRSPEIAKRLIQAGADTNARYLDGATPLHLASEANQRAAVDHLLHAGADLNARDKDDRTPLHYAATNGSPDIAEHLIRAGAEPNIPDINGATPLHLAYAAANDDAARTLVHAGADTNARDVSGRPAMGGQTVPPERQAEYDRLQKQVNPTYDDGRTRLHRAAINGSFTATHQMLQRGADPNVRDPDGVTPLHEAACAPDAAETVERLIKAGAEPNARDPEGNTPLHFAVAAEEPRSVEHLLQAQANPNIQDKDGRTPLHYAGSVPSPELATRLLEAGAEPNIRDNYGKTPAEMAAERRDRLERSTRADETVKRLQMAATPARDSTKTDRTPGGQQFSPSRALPGPTVQRLTRATAPTKAPSIEWGR